MHAMAEIRSSRQSRHYLGIYAIPLAVSIRDDLVLSRLHVFTTNYIALFNSTISKALLVHSCDAIAGLGSLPGQLDTGCVAQLTVINYLMNLPCTKNFSYLKTVARAVSHDGLDTTSKLNSATHWKHRGMEASSSVSASNLRAEDIGGKLHCIWR